VVEYTKEEIAKIPSQFHPLMQQFPNCFHSLLDEISTPWKPMKTTESIEVFFDDYSLPALAVRDEELFGKERKWEAYFSTDDPVIISGYRNDRLIYMEIISQVILRRQDLSELKVFGV
jgi:hypothetical protein